ncbi:MAG: hypothetical protein O9301_08480 [Leptospira sp.]|nr:hypothetical protein [Leptospira sp.]
MEINLSTNFFKTIELYKSLPGSRSLPEGRYEVSWVGPNWFQSLAKNGLGVLGFKNWVGKEFSGSEFAINIFSDENGGNGFNKFPMEVALSQSQVDSKACIRVSYPKTTPFPWPLVVDEFRVLNANTLVGLSYTKGLSVFPLPFYLIQK